MISENDFRMRNIRDSSQTTNVRTTKAKPTRTAKATKKAFLAARCPQKADEGCASSDPLHSPSPTEPQGPPKELNRS